MSRFIRAVTAVLAVLATTTSAAPAGGHQDADTYDYIVVGSGPGGAPVASNLAKAGYSVLLLEAGDDQGSDVSTQILSIGFPQFTNRWDFYVRTYSDPAQQLKNNHLTWQRADGSLWVGNGSAAPADAHLLGVYYPRGATLGGSSVINAAVVMLPRESYWDSIASLAGDKSWSATNMRQIFQRIERNHYLPPGTPGHGFDGYLDTNGNNGTVYVDNPGLTAVLKAEVASVGDDPAKILSLVQRDINNVSPDRDKTQGLFGLPYHATEFWRRFSARDIVLSTLNATKANGAQRYPLTLSVNSLATKILFDKSSKKPRATGVEYLVGKSLYSGDPRFNASSKGGGTLRRATARKEVILSGGVFNTPQLLLLSGIGPKSDLAKLNITTVVDLPGVGRRLQDNPEMPVVGVAKQPFVTVPEPGDPVCTQGAPGDPCIAAWEQHQGPYARAQLNTNAFMLRSNHSGAKAETDLLVFAIPYPFRGYYRFDAYVNFPPDPPSSFGLSLVKMYPANRAGVLKLRSADPTDTPDIDFKYFTDNPQEDLDAMSDAVGWARGVYGAVEAPYGPMTPTEPPCPAGGAKSCVGSDQQWVRDQAFGHHASGTCAIGADGDSLAVLDSKFRVRGVAGLRVVDGSAFPSPPGAFPVISTFLISEKASQDILRDA